MSIALPPQAYHAMRVQLDRVNAKADPARLTERIAELERELASVKLKLQNTEAELAATREGASETQISQPRQMHNGRPVLSVAEAGKLTGVSKATISRYLNTRWWDGDQYKTRLWWVYADQSFPKKRKAV